MGVATSQIPIPENPEANVPLTASDGTPSIPNVAPAGQAVGSQFYQIFPPDFPGGGFEGLITSPPAGAAFHSLGPLKLAHRWSRAAIQVNLANSGSLPAGGAQYQILTKASVNAPWFVAYSWAQISGLTPNQIPSGDAPLYLITDQSSFVFPINSNVIFNMDVRALYAVDVQISLTAGAYSAVAQLFAGVKNKG